MYYAQGINNTMSNFFRAVLAISIILIALSISYYFVVFIPNKEKYRLELEKQKIQAEQQKYTNGVKEKQSKIILLNKCLDDAHESLSKDWDAQCKVQGKQSECTLQSFVSDKLELRYKEIKEECFKKYPQN